jgi:hypothetical protein
MIPYLGKGGGKKTSDLQGEYTVNQLMKSYEHKGHFVTCENFFLRHKPLWHMIFWTSKHDSIGTIQKNKKELLPIVRELDTFLERPRTRYNVDDLSMQVKKKRCYAHYGSR